MHCHDHQCEVKVLFNHSKVPHLTYKFDSVAELLEKVLSNFNFKSKPQVMSPLLGEAVKKIVVFVLGNIPEKKTIFLPLPLPKEYQRSQSPSKIGIIKRKQGGLVLDLLKLE